jgi:hypothetical protein
LRTLLRTEVGGPGVLPEAAQLDPKKRVDLTAKAVKEALVSNTRIWLYQVSSFWGKKEAGLVAFSREYLHDAVYTKLASDTGFKWLNDGARAHWLETHLGQEIESVLKRHNARSGYATLAGVARPVWVLRQSQIKLEKGQVDS